jgi:hypothetical protein
VAYRRIGQKESAPGCLEACGLVVYYRPEYAKAPTTRRVDGDGDSFDMMAGYRRISISSDGYNWLIRDDNLPCDLILTIVSMPAGSAHA